MAATYGITLGVFIGARPHPFCPHVGQPRLFASAPALVFDCRHDMDVHRVVELENTSQPHGIPMGHHELQGARDDTTVVQDRRLCSRRNLGQVDLSFSQVETVAEVQHFVSLDYLLHRWHVDPDFVGFRYTGPVIPLMLRPPLEFTTLLHRFDKENHLGWFQPIPTK